MLTQLDTIIAFAVVMALVSLLVTIISPKRGIKFFWFAREEASPMLWL